MCLLQIVSHSRDSPGNTSCWSGRTAQTAEPHTPRIDLWSTTVSKIGTLTYNCVGHAKSASESDKMLAGKLTNFCAMLQLVFANLCLMENS